MEFILVPLGFLAAIAAMQVILGRRSQGRRRAFGAGGEFRVRVLLSGDRGPYPGRLTPGRVQVSGGRPIWQSTTARQYDAVDLSGARPLRAEQSVRSMRARPSDTGLVVLLPTGARLQLAAYRGDIALLEDVFERSGGPAVGVVGVDTGMRPQRRVRVPGWARILLGLCAVWAAFWLWVWTAGTTLDAKVLEPPTDDGMCAVSWSDPAGGAEQRASVSCGPDTKPGDTIRVLALPPPLNGEAGTIEDSLLVPLLIGGGVFVPTAIALVRRNWPRRRRAVPGPPVPVLRGSPVDVPDLAEGEVHFTRIAEVMATRAQAEGWADLPGPAAGAGAAELPSRWWRIRELRRLGSRSLLVAVFPLLFAGLAALLGASCWYATIVLATGDTTVVDGKVVSVYTDSRPPFMPYDVEVAFTSGGREHTALVPGLDKLDRGASVEILHSVAHPGAARLSGDGDGLARSTAVTGLAAGIAVTFAATRVRRVHRAMRDLRRVRGEPGRPWRFVRFVGPNNVPGLMLFSQWEDAPPTVLVPLNPLDGGPDGLPVSGIADIHGEVTDGAHVVAVVDGRTLWPVSPAQDVPPDLVRSLVNGESNIDPRRPRRGMR